MSGPRRRLEPVIPPPDHAPTWRRLKNVLYLVGEDALFVWAKRVQKCVEEAERRRRRAA